MRNLLSNRHGPRVGSRALVLVATLMASQLLSPCIWAAAKSPKKTRPRRASFWKSVWTIRRPRSGVTTLSQLLYSARTELSLDITRQESFCGR